MAYKYIYLEQSVYLLANKVNKLEIELNNPSIDNNYTKFNNKSNSALESAEIIMNEIFNDGYCSTSGTCSFIPPPTSINTTPTNVPVSNSTSVNKEEIQENNVQIVNEIFDLKKEVNDDKESIISSNVGGGHATKKALMKLSIDKLKAKCEERKLSTEGTKNQLADKIIVHDNTVEISDINDD
jgi:isopropylmalate/homocitrate/citramalate synthase